MPTLTILGSTGSIGSNTLDVIRRNRDGYRIFALAAKESTDLLASQILEFWPKVAVVGTDAAVRSLSQKLAASGLPRHQWPELMSGPNALVQIARASEIDFVMSAIVGVAGLEATYEAVRAGKRIGLANKEVLVSAGSLVMQALRQSTSELIPVDSEHNGAHQCLRAGNRESVRRLILTASGGPFRKTPAEKLESVTPFEALNHPTWRMGNRITIDSATLMNKGFEVIEACWLFDLTPSQVEVVIHPQSTIHAMIEYCDGSIIAQISATDMRMPIQYALTYPQRAEAPVPRLDWSQSRAWEFFPPDFEKFPLLKLAYEAQKAGGAATCILNAADEVAVEAFLHHEISFPAISAVVEETLRGLPYGWPQTIGDILEIDKESRCLARQLISRRASARVKPAQASAQSL